MFKKILSSTAIVFIQFCALTFAVQSYGSTFKVLTFNTWLLRTPLGADQIGEHLDLADDIDARVRIMPDLVAATQADIIAFQEVWNESLRLKLMAGLRLHGYNYFSYGADVPFYDWPKNRFGNGLLIASKFPTDGNTAILSFSVHTRGDETVVAKGAIRARISIPDLGWIDFYDSHLGAVSYDLSTGNYNPVHAALRLQQARELFQWIPMVKSFSHMILGVDLNTHYEGWQDGMRTGAPTAEYALFTDRSSSGLNLVDGFRGVNGVVTPNPYTFDDANPYVNQGHFAKAPSEMIDYIFSSSAKDLVPIKSERVFMNAIDPKFGVLYQLKSLPKRLSDHYGVLTTFEVR